MTRFCIKIAAYFAWSHMRPPLVVYMIIMVFCLPSCSKDKITRAHEELNSPTTSALNKIVFLNDSVGYIVGGKLWDYGLLLGTRDSGSGWTMDTLSDFTLTACTGISDTSAFVIGISPYLHTVSTHDYYYHPFHDKWLEYRDLCYDKTKELAYIVSGDSYVRGAIYVKNVNLPGEAEIKTDFSYELDCIALADDGVVVAGGWGGLVRTTDNGKNWEKIKTDGDQIMDICFTPGGTGLAVGWNGSIYKSTDNGLGWSKTCRIGNNVSHPIWAAVYMSDSRVGYIAGDKGVYYTDNGGEDWSRLDLPEYNYKSLWITNKYGYASTDNGRIIRFGI